MPAQHRHDLPSRLGEQRRIGGQLGDAEPRQAVLARAEDLALAAKGQIHLGELEPVADRRDRLHPPAGELGLGIGEQDAMTLMPSATHPPAELVELGEAVALAPSISITVALGTSMPTSITVVATSTSMRPATNRSIASDFSAEDI